MSSTPSSKNNSSNGLWWILASVPLVLVGILFALGVSSGATSSGSGSDEIPGLDFGTGAMFDSIATRYDTINRVLALRMDIGWRRKMTTRIKELLGEQERAGGQPKSSWRILDVATGTADVALQLIDDLSGGGDDDDTDRAVTVLGLDPSANMLAVGRSKIHDKGLDSRIRLEQADARDLSHYYQSSDNAHAFDAATIAFGIRNVVPNRSKALCEIHRLLAPGGVLAILEFSQPTYEEHGILGAAAAVFISRVVPVVGGLLSGGARKEYQHLQNSIKGFPGPAEFRQQLQDLDCPLMEDDPDHYFYAGHYEMENVTHMNFGSVQLYIGRAAVKPKAHLVPKGGSKSGNKNNNDDPVLPPIGKVE